jgi:hypothetical protein
MKAFDLEPVPTFTNLVPEWCTSVAMYKLLLREIPRHAVLTRVALPETHQKFYDWITYRVIKFDPENMQPTGLMCLLIDGDEATIWAHYMWTVKTQVSN